MGSMSASNPPPPATPDEPISDGWSDLTPEERAEIDEVLPRYRRAG